LEGSITKVKDPVFGASAASTSEFEVKSNAITEDFSLYHAMNMIMSRFDRLEGKRFEYPITTLPYDASTSG
jgi:hypothetical protein